MNKHFVAALCAATLVVPAAAQRPDRDDRPGHHDDRGDRDDRHDRGGDRDDRHDRGHGRSDWRTYRNYDYNRPAPGGAYYADNYYRADPGYRERRLSRNDRIYRGRNGQYYCRRTDGTTGLIVGGVAGGLLGNALANGGSSTLATLLGAGGGALLGRSIDRGNVRCR